MVAVYGISLAAITTGPTKSCLLRFGQR